MERQIANFHTLFNIGTTIILLPFTKFLVWLATKIVPDKKDAQEEKHKLTFIDERLLETPPIAAANTKNEIIKMANISKENIAFSMEMLLTGDTSKQDLIKDNEEALNFLNKSIVAYLTKLISKEVSREEEKTLSTYFHVVSDIERIGDYCENIMEYSERLISLDTSFSDEAKKELQYVKNTVILLFDKAMIAFVDKDKKALQDVDVLEEKVDEASRTLEGKHIERLKKGTCNADLGSVYLQTVSNLERVGDHITNIAFSILQYKN